MSRIVDCPSCARKLRLPEDLLNVEVQCPGCGTVFTGAEAEAPEPTAAPVEDHLETVEEEPPAKVRLPARRRSRELEDEDEDEDEDDYEDRPRRRRGPDKPSKVQAIAIMVLVGGILAAIEGGCLALSCYGLLWPGTYYSLVIGIMAIVEGTKLLGPEGHWRPPPKLFAILLVVNILNANIADCVMGIVSLVFLNEPEVQDYYRG